jgi:hypothetical protein
MDIFKKTALGLFVSASLVACGGGGGDSASNNNSGTTGTTYNIESGAFQKGPFIAGTTVTIQELGEDLKPTGVTYTAVTDDTGRFNASNIKSRFVEVFADGYYFDELNNAKSKAPVTLRAILDLTASGTKPSINTLTTMQTERLREVKKSGKTFQQAEADSRNAVLSVFGLPANAVTRLDSINLTGTSAGDESLLRATVALLQVATNQSSSVEAELTTLVAKLGSDLKDDGQANGAAKDFVTALQSAQTQVDTEYVRSLVQDYLGIKGQSEPQVIGTSAAPKLSQWISMRREAYGLDVPVWLWAIRDDGTVWKWQLAEGQVLQQVTSLKNIVSLHFISEDHVMVVLDKAGNVYKFNTLSSQATLIDTGVKQISEVFYLKQDGTVMNWSKQIVPNIPLMNRLIGNRKGDTSSVVGGIGKADAQLYYFKYNAAHAFDSVVKVGKYNQAQVLLTDRTSYIGNTSPEYPAAVLNGNVWSFLNSQGQVTGQQTLPDGTIYTHVGGMGFGQWSPVLAGDGNLWYWSADAHNFVKSTCGDVKKTSRAEVVLLKNGTVRPIVYTDTGVGNVSCPTSNSFDQLAAAQVVDVYSLPARLIVAVTADNKLIARFHTGSAIQWQGQTAVYTTSFSQ